MICTWNYRRKFQPLPPPPSPSEHGPLKEIAENVWYYPPLSVPPPANLSPLKEITENFCYYPPPPPKLVGFWRSRKIYRVASAWLPQTKILATPLPGAMPFSCTCLHFFACRSPAHVRCGLLDCNIPTTKVINGTDYNLHRRPA